MDIPIMPISQDETLCRIIFTPHHVSGDKSKLKPGAFMPPYNVDEVSVHRLNLTTETFCKQWGKKMAEQPNSIANGKQYLGLAGILVISVTQSNAFVKHTPRDSIPAHSDIYYNIVRQKGQTLNPKLVIILSELVKKAKFYKDTDLQSDTWNQASVSISLVK